MLGAVTSYIDPEFSQIAPAKSIDISAREPWFCSPVRRPSRHAMQRSRQENAEVAAAALRASGLGAERERYPARSGARPQELQA